MSRYFIIVVCVILTFIACSESAETKADKYVVNKSTTGCKCTVQLTTARPQLGQKFLGPFNTKEEAIAEMCKNVDPELSDPNKCWEVNPNCP